MKPYIGSLCLQWLFASAKHWGTSPMQKHFKFFLPEAFWIYPGNMRLGYKFREGEFVDINFKGWFYVSFYPMPHFIISNFPCCPLDLFPVHIHLEGLGLLGAWFIKASPIRFLTLVRCLQDLFPVGYEYGSSSSPSWVNVLKVKARFKAQLTSLDPYGFWGYLLSCQHIDEFKNIFYYFNYFSVRGSVTLYSVSYYWKMDFLSLKIIYSCSKFKIGMKRSFMNNR